MADRVDLTAVERRAQQMRRTLDDEVLAMAEALRICEAALSDMATCEGLTDLRPLAADALRSVDALVYFGGES